MLGKLIVSEIEELLERQVVGRLGCNADGESYVVPINFFYKDRVVYAQSGEGKKMDMMRKNPRVCFEVDEIVNTFKWKSVILIGKFEEVSDVKEKEQAIENIKRKMMPLSHNPDEKPAHAINSGTQENIEYIIFKIIVETRTGRYEKNDPY